MLLFPLEKGGIGVLFLDGIARDVLGEIRLWF
jgi:hypothetical protein